MSLQKRIGSIVRATSSGGATNCQLTVTANPTIRSTRSTTQLSRCGFVWLPATCHSIGKFPFRHAATFATDLQSCKIIIVEKYLFFALLETGWSPLLLLLVFFCCCCCSGGILLNTNTSSQLLPSVLRTHVVDFSFLRTPLSSFCFYFSSLSVSAHF